MGTICDRSSALYQARLRRTMKGRASCRTADRRNFTRAAARCHITQPALSRQVSEVERTLGTQLFERQTRRVSVTPSGRLFVREARRALEQSQRAASLVRALTARENRPVGLESPFWPISLALNGCFSRHATRFETSALRIGSESCL